MSSKSSTISLIAVKRFLSSRGWMAKRANEKFENYTPPSLLGLPKNFIFTLPIEQLSADDKHVVEKAIQSIANLYDITSSEISVLLTDSRKEYPQANFKGTSVLSTRLIGSNTLDGSISFRVFDQFIGDTKKLLLDAAAFAVTNAPKIEMHPVEAGNFLDAC